MKFMKFTINRKNLLIFIEQFVPPTKNCSIRFYISDVQAKHVFVAVTDLSTWGIESPFKLENERFLPGETVIADLRDLQIKLESIPAECVTFEFPPALATVSGGAFTYGIETVPI